MRIEEKEAGMTRRITLKGLPCFPCLRVTLFYSRHDGGDRGVRGKGSGWPFFFFLVLSGHSVRGDVDRDDGDFVTTKGDIII